MTNSGNRKSFTLIELLVVLALVAILSVVVVMTLNPAELLKQARDSNRLSDLSTINTALNLFSADVTAGFMGTSTVVYVSIPDTSPTCANLGLPLIPTSTYTYNCVTSANLRNTDGTGWIPVNFQRISSNSPISQLPVDPQNTTSTKYYTYVTGGSWKVIATPESVKYASTAGTDGGSNIGQFEVGNDMSLAPFADGLVGWWKFDEGSGTSTTVDSSGYGNTGTWNGTSTSRYVSGKVGQYAGYFNGGSSCSDIFDKVVILDRDYFSIVTNGGLTVSEWVKPLNYVTYSGYKTMIMKSGDWYSRYFPTGGNPWYAGAVLNTTNTYEVSNGQNISFDVSIWNFVSTIFTNTQVCSSVNGGGFSCANYNYSQLGNGAGQVVFAHNWGCNAFSGYLDDVRIYKRALSAAEVSALYNSTR